MIKEINKVAVLGTGVMGAQIAAHLTNAKIPVYAFDMSQDCLLYTSPSPRDRTRSRMPSSA